jgi:hypothetical protein
MRINSRTPWAGAYDLLDECAAPIRFGPPLESPGNGREETLITTHDNDGTHPP